METRPYVVRQGDYLVKLAHTMGFDADEVWNDEANRELRARRPDPNLLAPGDLLRVPERRSVRNLPLVEGAANRFKGRIPRITVSVVFRDGAAPLKGESYVIRGAHEDLEGKSDEDGSVTFDVPVDVREVRVVFYEKRLTFALFVGDLDPVEETSGARQRLAHLGYEGWVFGEAALSTLLVDGDNGASAVRAFQHKNGLAVTGAIDEATRQALLDAHGG